MPGGPQPIERGQRFETALAIADRIHQHYGERVLAIGLYGSVARGADGPYSDIEMHCVLHGADFEVSHEWSAGPWKAEVDVYSQDVMLARARTLDLDWPLTHRSYVEVMPLYDPTGFFERLRVAVLDHPDQAFRQLIGMTIVGEVYEVVGKVRNARAAGNDTYLPTLAVDLIRYGAFLIGLDRRHLYSGSAWMLEESLKLPGRPGGYDDLCRAVMAGQLEDPARIAALVDGLWSGVEQWAAARGIPIEMGLDALLAAEANYPGSG